MSKLACPYCGKPGISVIRKMFLGPAVPATCKACGEKIGVPYAAMFAGVPFVAAVLVTISSPFWLKATLWTLGALMMSAIHYWWVPLQRR